LGAFLGVSRQGEFKNTTEIFLQKVHVENKLKNFDKNFDVSFSSTFFVLSRFRVFFSDGSSKTLQKTFYKKNRAEKFFTKNSTKNPKPTFSRILFYHVFGRFSMRGVQKHDLTLVLFLTPTHPPTTGVPGFFFGWPLDRDAHPTPGLHQPPMIAANANANANANTHRRTTKRSSFYLVFICFMR
jgi:hypothetical protein